MDCSLPAPSGTPLHPVHATPGRLRLKAGPPADGAGPCWALRDALAAHDGIALVEYRPASHSFIIRYDPERWDRAALAETAALNGFQYSEEAPVAAPSPLSPPPTEAGLTASAPRRAMALVDPQSLLMIAFLWSWIRSAIRGTAGISEWMIIVLSVVNLLQYWQRKLEHPAAADEEKVTR